MIDLDDVISESSFLHHLNDLLNTNYKIEDLPTYYIQDLVPDNLKDEFFKLVTGPLSYKYSKPIKDSIEVINKLILKYNVYICTAFYTKGSNHDYGDLLKEKYLFIRKYLPNIKPENIFMASNKNIINFDIKIDDSIKNLECNAELKLLFKTHANKNTDSKLLSDLNVHLVDGWAEIEEILL